MTPRIYTFESTGEAYDDSQTGFLAEDIDWDAHRAASEAMTKAFDEHGAGSDEFRAAFEAYEAFVTEVKDGDILHVPSENAIGIMVKAWPTAIDAEHAGDNFHVLIEGVDWSAVDGQDYTESLTIAQTLLTQQSA